MLIFSRKRDEQIVIGDGIVITVVSIRGSRVQIGIEARSHVSVRRKAAMTPEVIETLLASAKDRHVSDSQPEDLK